MTYNDGRPRLPRGSRTPLYKKWQAHKYNAKRRGIPFRLTFEQWFDIWQGSGCIHLMGKGAGRYVMARHGDLGAYEIGNVAIITNIENISVPRTPAMKQKISDALSGVPFTQQHKSRISAALKGRVFSAETRRRMSISAQNRRTS